DGARRLPLRPPGEAAREPGRLRRVDARDRRRRAAADPGPRRSRRGLGEHDRLRRGRRPRLGPLRVPGAPPGGSPGDTARVTLAVLAGVFALTSPAFHAGGTIGKAYTCDGRNGSPPLRWT